MKIEKRVLSIILSVIMILGISVTISISVSAVANHSKEEALAWLKDKADNHRVVGDGWCSALASGYIQYLTGSFLQVNGKDYATRYPSGWSPTKYYSGYVPQPGDLVVYDYSASAIVNGVQCGHVGVVYSANSSSFTSVEQNVSGKYTQYCYNRSYNNSSLHVWGFVRPNFASIHTHNYNTFVEYQSAHPHYAVYKCSCGTTQVDKSKSEFNPTCNSCITGLNAEQTISDGEYLIASAIDQSSCLNVASSSKESGANVHLWKTVSDDNVGALLIVKYIGDGYYSLTFKNSGKALDVYQGYKAPGTNVQQYTPNTSNSQKWVIRPNDDNYTFSIVSRCNGLYLDAKGGTAENGTNIQVYTGNNSKGQKWRFIRSGMSTGQTISDGDYLIGTALDNTSCINIASSSKESGANAHLWKTVSDNNTGALVSVKYQGNGYYSLVMKNSGMALDVYNSEATKGANVQQYKPNDSSCQQWIIKEAGDGRYFNIISKSSGLYLDAKGNSSDNGTNIQAYIGNGSKGQKWRFIYSGVSTDKSIDEGNYYIFSDSQSGYSLDVLTISDYEKIILKNSSYDELKSYSLSYIGNGYYTVLLNGTEQYLDVKDFNAYKNAEVQLLPRTKLNAQRWIIKPTNDGKYNLVSKEGGLFLDSTSNNEVKMNIGNNGITQKWRLEKVDESAQSTTSSYETEPITETIQQITGDVTRDGGLDVRDATAIKRSIAKIITLSDEQMVIADVNKDGGVDVRDATLIQRAIARITEL